MKIDFHIHSKNSTDSNATFKEIEEIALMRGLDGVAITDHNVFSSFKSKKILVIPGEEILTRAGEILGLGLKKGISRDLSPQETIEIIHKQGGIAVAPHPFDFFRKGLGSLMKELNIDAVEVFNSRTLSSMESELARKFAQKHKLSVIGGSDAHVPEEVGNVYTELDAKPNIKSVLNAVKKGQTKVSGHYSSPIFHISSLSTKFKKRFL